MAYTRKWFGRIFKALRRYHVRQFFTSGPREPGVTLHTYWYCEASQTIACNSKTFLDGEGSS